MLITITGGGGYLGSVLSRLLLKAGHQVRVIDNLLYGQDSLSEIENQPNFELVQSDIRDLRALAGAVEGSDAVVHLAAIVGDQASDIDAKTTTLINLLTTESIAGLCELYGVKKLLFASTCTVYGVRPGQILDEKTKPEPFSLYGTTKHLSEKAILQKARHYKPTIFRIGTLFGLSPRMRFDLAINLFTAEAVKNRKIKIFGGTQFRPFIHVEDAAESFLKAIENNNFGVFNLGKDNISILEVGKLIKEILPETQIEVTKEIADLRNYMVSWEKAKKELKIHPQRTIKDGIREIVEAFKNRRFQDYPHPRYGNYSHILDSLEVRKKVYTQGPIFNNEKKNISDRRQRQPRK